MGKKRKLVPTYSTAFKQLADEVPNLQYQTYEVNSIPDDFPHRPSDSKVTHYAVAVSGEPTSNIQYMLVCPHRVDANTNSDGSKTLVYDIDPLIVILDSETKEFSPSGLVLFHQKFDGRTSQVDEAIEFEDYPQSVAKLKSQLVTGQVPLDNAPPEIQNAFNHAVSVLNTQANWPMPDTTELKPPSPDDQGTSA